MRKRRGSFAIIQRRGASWVKTYAIENKCEAEEVRDCQPRFFQAQVKVSMFLCILKPDLCYIFIAYLVAMLHGSWRNFGASFYIKLPWNFSTILSQHANKVQNLETADYYVTVFYHYRTHYQLHNQNIRHKEQNRRFMEHIYYILHK